jgi:hypothetical protein
MLHYNTKNVSFLKLYYLLKEFGIQNNSFFLELYDESLLNINPLDEDSLTKEQKIRVHAEISRNPWYYIREIVRIPTAGVKQPFELTRGTLAICWSIINNISSIVILPRQCFKTYTVMVMYGWFYYWGTSDTDFLLFSYNDSILQANLQRIKEIRDNLPSYLNLYDSKRDKDNAREMRFNNNNNLDNNYYNHIRIKAPSLSKDSADKIGRGFSAPIINFDELCYIPNIKIIYESSTYTYRTAAEIASKNNSYYHRIMTSSAGHLDNETGDWAFNFMNSCCEYNEKMFDYSLSQVKEMISLNSTNNYLVITFMWYDLGKDDNYLEEMKKDAVSEDAFRREVLNSWERTDEDHPLGKELVSTLYNYITNPQEIIVIDSVYFLKLYKPISEIDFNKSYVAGVDCGGNLLSDFSTFVLVDPENFETLATLRTNSHSTNRFAKAIAYILLRIFTNTMVIIERNAMGIAQIDYLVDNFPQLKHRIYYDIQEKPGFATTTQTRPLLFNNLLKVVVVEDYTRLHDKNIINEILGLKKGKNGRIDHQENGHDDTLIAYLFTRWFFTYAKNVSKYIDPTMIGREVNTEELGLPDTIIKASKGEHMRNNYKTLLYGDELSNELNSDGTFSENLRNPRVFINKMETIERIENSEDVVSAAFSDIVDRLEERDYNIERKELTTLDVEEMSEEEFYEDTPDKIKDKFNDKTETQSIFKSTLLGEITGKDKSFYKEKAIRVLK